MSKKLEFDEASVQDAIERFGEHWKTLPDDSRILAEKITMLTAYAGGRKRAAEAMGVGPTTLDNYRAGKTQPKFLEMLKLAEAARHDFNYLVAGSTLQDWAAKSIHELRPHEDDAENYDNAVDHEIGASEAEMPAGHSAAARSMSIDPHLLRKLHRAARLAYKEAGHRPPDEDSLAIEAGRLYNVLLEKVADVRESRIVDAVIPVLIEDLKAQLAEATVKPGTGKASAS